MEPINKTEPNPYWNKDPSSHVPTSQPLEDTRSVDEDLRYLGDDERFSMEQKPVPKQHRIRSIKTSAKKIAPAIETLYNDMCLDSPLPETTVTEVDFGTWSYRLKKKGQRDQSSDIQSVDHDCSSEDAAFPPPKRGDRYATFHGSGSRFKRSQHRSTSNSKRRRAPSTGPVSDDDQPDYSIFRNVYPYTTLYHPRRSGSNVYVLPTPYRSADYDPYYMYRSWNQNYPEQQEGNLLRSYHSMRLSREPQTDFNQRPFKVYDFFNEQATPENYYGRSEGSMVAEISGIPGGPALNPVPPPMAAPPPVHIMSPPHIGYDPNKLATLTRSHSEFQSSGSILSEHRIPSLDDSTTQRRCIVGWIVGLTTVIVIGLAIALFVQVNADADKILGPLESVGAPLINEDILSRVGTSVDELDIRPGNINRLMEVAPA